MKNCIRVNTFIVLLIPVVLLLVTAQSTESAKSSKEIAKQNWELVEDWPRLPPGFEIEQVSGVAIDNSGHVFVFHRAGKVDRSATTVIPTVTVFKLDSETGGLLDSWGAGHFVRPHSITVDGENNIWLTDTNLHQVFKFSDEGRLLLSIGNKAIRGNDDTHFGAPSDVTVAPDSSFYVSDGYDNSRVVHFSAHGAFVNDWGIKGTNPGQFVLPHGIALDSKDRVYVADRENQRLQVFDKFGAFVLVWPKRGKMGRVTDVVITPSDHIHVAISVSDRGSEVRILNPKWREVGRLVAGPSVVAHQIAVSEDNAIYVVDLRSGRILKYVRR